MWTTVAMIILALAIVKCYIVHEDTHRSATFRTTDNYMLNGYAFHKQRSTTVLECASVCLGENRCWSFNFHNSGISTNCYLNSKNVSAVEEWNFWFSKGFTYGEIQNKQVFSSPVKEFVFTSLGAGGRSGPTDTSGYNGTNLKGGVALVNGKQKWTVPKTATYIIEGYGASGADGNCPNGSAVCFKGGLGAKITGTFYLTMGTSLTILVGQKGSIDNMFNFAGGGGGGTFVINDNDSTKLMIAGGGGGAGKPEVGFNDGDPGQAGNNGTRCGGVNGMGGRLCKIDSFDGFFCSSGAGYSGDGEIRNFMASKSFTNGGMGGKSITSENCVGGFGGGGYGMEQAGGGGGYSGGGYIGNKTTGTAGGGGSYNSGLHQNNQSGVNKGDGKVIIIMM